jgi:2-iminobutanoate/2-iminopropanoate deaminase
MTPPQQKLIAHTDKAPKAIGPYSQAVRSGELVYTAGQIGLDPSTTELVEGGIQAETRRALTNLSHVLAACGSSLSLALKTTVYLADMQDFGAMNSIYAEFFPSEPPARSTVGVSSLPKGARVEIEVIAVRQPVRGD